MLQRIWRVIAGMILGALLLSTGGALFAARMAVFPVWYRYSPGQTALAECSSYQKRVYVYCADPEKSLGLPFQEFKTERGESGWWVSPKPGAGEKGIVLLMHGGGADRRAMLKHVSYLVQAGYHAVLFDARNHGTSSGDRQGISFGMRESESIVSAVDWAVAHIPTPRLPIFAMGTSQGGFAALRAAAMDRRIEGVISENAYRSVSDALLEFPSLQWMPTLSRYEALLFISFWLGSPVWEIDAGKFAKDLETKRVLLIHGDADRVVRLHHAQELYSLLPNPENRKQLWVVPGGEHEFLWNIVKEEYQERVLGFLNVD